MTRTDADATFAETLDAAMLTRGMSLTQVRDDLAALGHPVSLASLSYWRAGSREPQRRRSLDAVPELERLLGLSGGTLSARIAGSRRGPGPSAFDRLAGKPLLEGLVGEDDVDRVLFHLVADVGDQRQITRARVTQVFVARRAGVDGVTIFVGPDQGTESNDAVLRAVSGCSIGEVRDVERGITATRLQFERPLMAGESAVTEYEVAADGVLDLETEYGIVAEQRLEEAMVWIRFDPACRPARAWVWFEEGGLRHDWSVELAGSTGLHYRQLAFGPGTLGARWEWE
ncbi:hypothetical protein [Aeromicrobium stalagmiti]|uniref:hypothetical protein n=1 Tax=Aeromicrobium stalagmiti TaxID=2738988 RepID=UPI001569C4CE|nr:hypothetical protein [Aeromicrobium stalagmiti]NRQ50864.1 hypothetical protein [Aeromicrobium stalagmiti]